MTVESASTSETEDTEYSDDVIHDPNLAKSLEKIDVTAYKKLQVRSMLLCLKLCYSKLPVKLFLIQTIMIMLVTSHGAGFLNNF